MRFFFSLLLSLACTLEITDYAIAQTNLQATDLSEKRESTKLLVGVRGSARPFSFSNKVPMSKSSETIARHSQRRKIATKSGPLQAAGYRGYTVYICDEVLKQMFIEQDHAPRVTFRDVVVVPIDRLIQQELEANEDRLTLLGNKIDILCDPATVTRERVAHYAVSPPLFLTGISYLARKDTVPPKLACNEGKALIGVVGSTTAARDGIEAILKSGEWRPYRRDIVRALRSGDNLEQQCPGMKTAIQGGETTAVNNAALHKDNHPKEKTMAVGGVIWIGSNHNEVARAFCEGLVTYYVGDYEIISENANAYPGCEWVRGARSFTDDRYAVFAYIDYNSAPQKALWIGRFFEVLNREIATEDSLLDRAYTATFGSAPKSKRLELFFWNMRGQD